MSAEITMPQLSDTMSEGTLVKWKKKEGDVVKSGEVIAEIETDKATMEMEAYESGTIAHIAVSEGAKVAVGAMIAILATASENPADVKAKLGGAAAGKTAQAAASVTAAPASAAIARQVPAPQAAVAQSAAGSGKPAFVEAGGAIATLERASTGEIHEAASAGHDASRSPATPVPPLPHNGNGHSHGGRIRVSPLARRIAKDRGIDLSLLSGSGPQGRIVQKDVLGFTPAAPAPAPNVAAEAATPQKLTVGAKEVIPLSKMRSVIAARLQQSKQQVPHFYETIDVDVEELSALRVRINQQLEGQKIRLSIGDFISKAVASALIAHPALNSHFDGQKMQITRHGSVNLGMAVALPDGLIVPVLRGIEQMGLKELRSRSSDLVDRARKQRLKQDEMSGATFSVSNLGSFGVREFSAIINPPEVGILAIAAAEKRAIVRHDAIVARTIMTLTLSVDHRAVDGAVAAEFLKTLKLYLEEPGMLLV